MNLSKKGNCYGHSFRITEIRKDGKFVKTNINISKGMMIALVSPDPGALS